ncbi:MAG: hypothetical protein PQJ46_10460 [Spirochaetales bacterium]|nr:hypothetical protein [Spirochaetales bacterium]
MIQAEYKKIEFELKSIENEKDHLTDGYKPGLNLSKLPEPDFNIDNIGKQLSLQRADIRQMEILINAAKKDIAGVNIIFPDGINLTIGGNNLLSSSRELAVSLGIDIPIFSIKHESASQCPTSSREFMSPECLIPTILRTVLFDFS